MATLKQEQRHGRQRVADCEGFDVSGLFAAGVVRMMAEKEGIDPRRLSFRGTLKILRCRLAECSKDAPGQHEWYEDLVKEIATEKLPPRRERINPRVIKRKMSKWAKKRAAHRNNPQPEKTFRESINMLD